ncbi:ABC transporter permease [Maricaulis sp.]|uniref:ABC transporter permease n=1 Tax=Maricaulis sp. TaxID=1486257 RepID=UPI003A8F6069
MPKLPEAGLALTGGLKDLIAGFADWRRWAWLGWYDVKLANRRSFVGAWWPTISVGIFVFGIGHLFAYLFGRPLEAFFPHIAVGWVVWQMIQTAVSSGTTCFTSARVVLQEAVMPINAIPLRQLVRIVIHFFMNSTLIAAAFLYSGQSVTWGALWAIPGLAVVIATLHGAMLFAGLVCVRVRAFGLLVDAGMRFAFFLTPIIWMPSVEGGVLGSLLKYNPFYYLVEVVRAPLISGNIDISVMLYAAGFSVIINIMAFFALVVLRRDLVLWA